jgi:alkylation response protein AidB-like acyl-CoA dehydrogenase
MTVTGTSVAGLGLSPEQASFKDSVEGFARKHLASGALERAHAQAYPRDVARLLAEQGLLGLTFDEAAGGQGATLLDAVIAIQAVATACPKSADVVQAGNFGPIRTFAQYSSPELRDRYLPDLLAGKTVMSLCMTEPEAGSAVTELSTTARVEGDVVYLNGTKVFSTHSPEADIFLVYARFGPGVGGIGSVIVERGAPGLSVGEPSTFMSGEQWCQLYFEECAVPASNILLGEGGFKKQISGFNVERLGNAARSLALGRYAYEQAREHALSRVQFGKALCEFQGIQWMFAEMAVKLDAAQLLLYNAATKLDDRGLPGAYETAAAKYAANQAGFEVANTALQVMGGTGYSQESLVEYCVRRTRGWMIAGGSTEVLKNRIAEAVFDRRFSQRGDSAR